MVFDDHFVLISISQLISQLS